MANSTFSSAGDGCERHGIKYELDLLTYIEWMACMKSMELDEILGEEGSTHDEAYCEGRWTNFSSYKAEEVDLDRGAPMRKAILIAFLFANQFS